MLDYYFYLKQIRYYYFLHNKVKTLGLQKGNYRAHKPQNLSFKT